MPLAQTVAFLVSLVGLWFLFQQQGTCTRCGGLGGHRRDCPLGDRDEQDEG